MKNPISVLFDTDIGNKAQPDLPYVPKDLGRGRVFYVSNDGCDDSDGLSPQGAWRSIEKVNALFLQPGDSVLLRRGDVFYGAHLELHGSGEGMGDGWITVDAYGTGEDPRLIGAVQNSPAVSLQDASVKGGYRIRHLYMDGYHLGIAAARGSAAQMLEDIEIAYCTICNTTTEREFDPQASLPCGAPLAFGMWLHYVRRLHVHHVTLHNTDCPFQFCGGYALFDRLDICNSHIQGVMIYGVRDVHTYEEIMQADGYVTLQNSRILYTGDRATKFGSTGCLIENIHHCKLSDVEVGYTVNTLGVYDACAVDWEQSNVECCFERVIAHDNQGPFILAMEHPESAGVSRGNVVKDCVSYHNGMFGPVAGNSFVDYSSYSYEHQRIVIEGCVDIAQKGVAPYAPESKEQALHPDGTKGVFPLDIRSLQTYTFAQNDYFDIDSTDAVECVCNGGVYNGNLVLRAGGSCCTKYRGKDGMVDLRVRGEVVIGVRCTNAWDGYQIRLRGNEMDALRSVQGRVISVQDEVFLGTNPNGWNRVVVSCRGEMIEVYVNRVLALRIRDAAQEEGRVLFSSPTGCSIGELRIFTEQASVRQKEPLFWDTSVPIGGACCVGSAHGEYGFFSPEIHWRAEGFWYWEYRPFRTAWGKLGGYGATLSAKDIDVDASDVIGAKVAMINATLNPRVYLDYTTDGEKWQTKELVTSCLHDVTLQQYPKPYPQMRAYDVDLRDCFAPGARICGLRLRFGAGCGIIALQGVTFYTDSEKG